jgi:hypothetical protein
MSSSNNLTLNTLSKESSAQLLGTGKSLAWDEFQNPDGLSSEESSPVKAAVTATAAADNSLFQATGMSTATAASLRDLLEKTNLNWETNYLCSPIGTDEKNSFLTLLCIFDLSRSSIVDLDPKIFEKPDLNAKTVRVV